MLCCGALLTSAFLLPAAGAAASTGALTATGVSVMVAVHFTDGDSTEDTVTSLLALLRDVKAGASVAEKLTEQRERMQRDERRGTLSPEKRREYERVLAFLREHENCGFKDIKADYDVMVTDMKKAAAEAKTQLEALFGFAEKVWDRGQELLILVTELTVNYYTARFIARYGCESYYKYNEEMMFYQRQTDIIRRIESISESI